MVDQDDSQLFREGVLEQSGVQLIEGYHHRVLLVHDDAEIVELMRLSLEQVGGLRVRVVASLADAADAAADWRPELLVVELADVAAAHASLLWLDGLPALAQLPIVALTPCEKVQVTERIRVVIQLPFDPLDFEGVVAAALAPNGERSSLPPDSNEDVFTLSSSRAPDSLASGIATTDRATSGNVTSRDENVDATGMDAEGAEPAKCRSVG